MRKIFLIRHAESAPADAQIVDFQRILTARGRTMLMQLAEVLKAQVKNPVEIHCSHAKRTVETAEVLASQLNGIVQPCVELYEGGMDQYLHLLKSLEHCQQVILVGHNPVISSVQYHLSGTFSPFQPGTCAVLAHEGGNRWRQITILQPGEQGSGFNPNLNA